MRPTRGLLTFEAEGTEGGTYHSRKLHVPDERSGLTLGRGYDMRHRTSRQIHQELMQAGMVQDEAETLSKAAGLFGTTARKFVKDQGLEAFQVSPQVQLRLFEITYQQEESEARRLCTKADVTARYGVCDWEALHPAIRDVVVDLKFRGDYAALERKHLQNAIVDNAPERFLELLQDAEFWMPQIKTPADRFQRRVEYMKRALELTASSERNEVSSRRAGLAR